MILCIFGITLTKVYALQFQMPQARILSLSLLTIWVDSLQTEQNGTGFMLKSPFEYQPNNNFASYGGWRRDEAVFYEVLSSITPTRNNMCKQWRLEVSSTNVLNAKNQSCS